MTSIYHKPVLFYLITITVSLVVTCGGGYFQMKYILVISDFEPIYFFAPAVIGLIFGVLSARIILLINKLKMFSVRDSLTHTFNHGYYKEMLKNWSLEKSTFSLIMLDIDYFKKVNDEYGHQVGDQTLIRLCELINETKRIYDIFARHGGEEFVILAPRTDLTEAADLATRLSNVIREASMPSGIKLTCSFGVAQFRIDSDTADTLFDRADKALYESKHNGRDRVMLESFAS